MRSLIVLAALTALTTGVAHASIIYDIDTTITSGTPSGNPLQSDTIRGSITTDGTIGALRGANVLSYSLALIDNLNASNDYTLTTTNSTVVSDGGGSLSASATALSFNFSRGEFLIQANTPGPYSGSRYFCFSSGGACAAGETISPAYVFTDGVTTVGSAIPVGMQSIGALPTTPTSPASPVPEPATLAILLTGLAAVTVARRRNA